ncbi:hypothetical protein PFICI_11962 [Pestalotiopsis fici W106-1]|uniref:Apple domain-containing protein n=1 Tax=Pestalotiopsis fici (strain W106-1 / CGMCC3.15140) TaxID=1229662 RepID=W3WRT1_PESFW|nr:uncharacterized protein PFICI_11962 [Pestalotiopsis fici W106-1]ETS76575.1 hypothetical protein PFICI_11962 [Pestalotiopsis fici W106-1]
MKKSLPSILAVLLDKSLAQKPFVYGAPPAAAPAGAVLPGNLANPIPAGSGAPAYVYGGPNSGSGSTGSGPQEQKPLGQSYGGIPIEADAKPSSALIGRGPGNAGEHPIPDGNGCPASRAELMVDQLDYADVPICPDGDGKLYLTHHGVSMRIQCCVHGGKPDLGEFIADDFRHCMNTCAQTKDCNSVQYLAHRGDDKTRTCALSTEGGFTKASCGAEDMHQYAYVIDAPAIEPIIFPSLKCTTECPFSNGQLFKSFYGESFLIDCGMRHGTQPFYKDHKSTLRSCINACGKLQQCQAVDYDGNRDACYYYTHQSLPTITAPGFASARSMGCEGDTCGDAAKQCSHNITAADQEPEQNKAFPQDGILGNPSSLMSLCETPSSHWTQRIGGKAHRFTCGSGTNCAYDMNIWPGLLPTMTIEDCIKECGKHPECRSANFFLDGVADGTKGRCNIRKCNSPTLQQPGLVGIYPL